MKVSDHYSAFKSRKMDTEIIEKLFFFGKFFALTPSSTKNQNPAWFQKIYEICVFVIYIGCLIASNYYTKMDYGVFTAIQFVLVVLGKVNSFSFVFYVLVTLMRLKRVYWFRLIENLSKIQQTTEIKYYYVMMGFFFTCYTIVITFGVVSSVGAQGPEVFRSVFSQYFENYVQLFYLLFTCVLLRMLLSKYKYQRNLLIQIGNARNLLYSKQLIEILNKIKISVFGLKECVEIYNDIFGWTILFTIFAGTGNTLIYLDIVIKRDFAAQRTFISGNEVIYDISVIVLIWIGILSTIFLCDTILNEADEILSEAYKLETSLADLNSYEHEEVQMFIDVLLHNRPEFRAARFFSIDRSTLFSVLNSLTTFLLVMIQFKTT